MQWREFILECEPNHLSRQQTVHRAGRRWSCVRHRGRYRELRLGVRGKISVHGGGFFEAGITNGITEGRLRVLPTTLRRSGVVRPSTIAGAFEVFGGSAENEPESHAYSSLKMTLPTATFFASPAGTIMSWAQAPGERASSVTRMLLTEHWVRHKAGLLPGIRYLPLKSAPLLP